MRTLFDGLVDGLACTAESVLCGDVGVFGFTGETVGIGCIESVGVRGDMEEGIVITLDGVLRGIGVVAVGVEVVPRYRSSTEGGVHGDL